MTRSNRWDEKKIESHLQQLPPIKDRQSKEELFQAIQQKMKEREEAQREPIIIKKKKSWIFPAIASAAAVFLILIMIPSFLNNNDQYSTGDYDTGEESSHDMMVMESSEDDGADSEARMEIATTEEIAEADEEAADPNATIMANMAMLPIPYTVDVPYPDGTMDFETFIVQESIPVPEEFGDSLEELLVYVLSSNQYGNTEVFQELQSIDMNYEDRIVTLDFSRKNRLESMAPGEMNPTTGSIIEIFSLYGFTEVKFTTEGEPGVIYGPTGQIDSFELLPDNRGYYLYRAEDGMTYFVRGASLEEPLRNQPDTLFTFEETLEKMKLVQEGAHYEPAIPDTVSFDEVSINDNLATVILSSKSSFINDDQFNFMVEAIRLAASDFPVDTLVIKGDIVEQYRAMESIEVPVTKFNLFE